MWTTLYRWNGGLRNVREHEFKSRKQEFPHIPVYHQFLTIGSPHLHQLLHVHPFLFYHLPLCSLIFQSSFVFFLFRYTFFPSSSFSFSSSLSSSSFLIRTLVIHHLFVQFLSFSSSVVIVISLFSYFPSPSSSPSLLDCLYLHQSLHIFIHFSISSFVLVIIVFILRISFHVLHHHHSHFLLIISSSSFFIPIVIILYFLVHPLFFLHHSFLLFSPFLFFLFLLFLFCLPQFHCHCIPMSHVDDDSSSCFLDRFILIKFLVFIPILLRHLTAVVLSAVTFFVSLHVSFNITLSHFLLTIFLFFIFSSPSSSSITFSLLFLALFSHLPQFRTDCIPIFHPHGESSSFSFIYVFIYLFLIQNIHCKESNSQEKPIKLAFERK